ncbi:MAG: PIG-L family deacetylase, partial [Flavobacteriaceae bacterium]|nr:PIG-L family deacetylase [Flavobacteriaceae bacterium]
DDENTRLISYMSNHVKARTGYLSITRGDGGQNLIGPEIRELLGVIRTQELLAARRIDGGEQLFTRANDFGYSKHPDETLAIWNKDEVLSDVVWAIRKFKPDVIINRFNHTSAGKTHGHHTSSALLSMEAFDLTNKKSAYAEQLEQVSLWQAKSLFFNTHWWFYESREKFEKVDKSNMINFDIGVYYPSDGLSNNEVASIASSQHLSQGFGRLTQRGSEKEYIEYLKGDFPEDKTNIFSGIDTSWNRIKDGQAIGNILYEVEKKFNFRDPSVHLSDLMKAYQLIQTNEDKHWKAIKIKEIKSIIEACAGLYLEASASSPTISNDSNIDINIEALSRNTAIELVSYHFSTNKIATPKLFTLDKNIKLNFKETISIPSATPTSSPYWLNNKGTLGMYNVDKQALIGLPETPRPIVVDFNLRINNSPITISKNVVYRYSKPDKGELYRPFEIIPEASVKISEKVFIFENDKQKNIEVTINAGRKNLEGFVSMNYPEGWNVYPDKQKLAIANKGENQTVVFTVIPPKFQNEGYISPIVNIDGEKYTKELVEIDYGHIPFQTVLLPSESKIVRLDIQKKGENIGYIEGAGDTVPESLKQIGYNVIIIKPENITP